MYITCPACGNETQDSPMALAVPELGQFDEQGRPVYPRKGVGIIFCSQRACGKPIVFSFVETVPGKIEEATPLRVEDATPLKVAEI